MANQIITLEIPGQVLQRRKKKIIKLIAIDLEEYRKETKRKKELEDAFTMISRGEKALREGKTIIAQNLDEALRVYAHKKH